MKHPEIELGARIILRLKTLSYPQEPWITVYRVIGKLLSHITRTIRPYYPGLDQVQLLDKLSHYTDDALREAAEIAMDGIKCNDNGNPQRNTGLPTARYVEKL